MKIEIRPATVHDAQRVAEIYLKSRRTCVPFAPLAHNDEEIHRWMKEQLIPQGSVTIAEQFGRIVGMLSISQHKDFGWIDHLYLDPEETGKGVGALLLKKAMEALKTPIRLYCFQENRGARKFYRQHGFREIEFSDGSTNEEKTPDVLLEWVIGKD